MPATTTLQALISRAQFIVQDATYVRWTQDEWTDWANDAQRAVVSLRPDAYTHNVAVQLVAGVKQALPADGSRLMAVRRNLGATGTAPGRIIRQTTLDVLDDASPDWPAAAASITVQNYAFDKRDPKTFYVYPPQPATPGYVEVLYSGVPPDLAALTDTSALDDLYSNALVDYMLYRAFLKETDYASCLPRASAHYQAFTQALGIKTQTDTAVAPKPEDAANNHTTPGN